jgi:hypothetical protein
LVRAALGGVLAVDEAVVLLAVVVGVGDGHFDIITTQVDDGIQRIAIHLRHQQVQQTVLALEPLAVVVDREAGVQVAVVPQQPLDVLIAEGVIMEHLRIGFEDDPRAVGLFGLHHLVVLAQDAPIELGQLQLPFPCALDAEIGTQGVHGLGTYTVQAHALLEGLAVVLGSRVDLAHHVDHLAQGHTTTVIADLHARALDGHVHLLAMAHDEFVDAVVQHLLQQDVDAVVVTAPIAQLADVHTRPQPDMFLPIEGPDVLFAVVGAAHGFRWWARR